LPLVYDELRKLAAAKMAHPRSSPGLWPVSDRATAAGPRVSLVVSSMPKVTAGDEETYGRLPVRGPETHAQWNQNGVGHAEGHSSSPRFANFGPWALDLRSLPLRLPAIFQNQSEFRPAFRSVFQ
jgi:hypothetical protein